MGRRSVKFSMVGDVEGNQFFPTKVVKTAHLLLILSSATALQSFRQRNQKWESDTFSWSLPKLS
jgi:hypothetical protein